MKTIISLLILAFTLTSAHAQTEKETITYIQKMLDAVKDIKTNSSGSEYVIKSLKIENDLDSGKIKMERYSKYAIRSYTNRTITWLDPSTILRVEVIQDYTKDQIGHLRIITSRPSSLKEFNPDGTSAVVQMSRAFIAFVNGNNNDKKLINALMHLKSLKQKDPFDY